MRAERRDNFDDKTRWDGRPKSAGCSKLILPVIILGCVALPFLPWKRVGDAMDRIKTPIIKEKRVEIKEPPPPLPAKFAYTKDINLTELSNGMQLRNEVEFLPGATATSERANDEAYQITFKVSVKVPTPKSQLADLEALNPHLTKALPGLAKAWPTAKVSGFFFHQYETKKKDIEQDISRLDKILTKHNFYDLETVMELEHPQTKRKALLIQSDMDVVSDGSDGDRMEDFDDYIAKSQHFQPTTSYWWKKRTSKPNPLLQSYQEKHRAALEKAKVGTAEQKKAAKAQADQLALSITDLKTKSYLIGQEDPFIVISLSMRSYEGFYAYGPGIGDYVLVIHGDKLLPAIIGDYGPREKSGEASLRIARELQPESSPYRRPVSDLQATYVIFPGTAEKPWQAPNYAKWRETVQNYVNEMGGLGSGYTLHTWEDRLANKVSPAPVVPASASQ